jgi:hypothetical protein
LVRCVHEVFGNPFRPPDSDPRWRGWNDGTIRKLAQVIEQERAWERMPFLGDALEEAGCTSVEMLDHCRQHGKHYRGCWVIDLLLRED